MVRSSKKRVSFGAEAEFRYIADYARFNPSGVEEMSNIQEKLGQCNDYRVLYYYCDMMLSRDFKPMGAQLSMKGDLPLAERIATV